MERIDNFIELKESSMPRKPKTERRAAEVDGVIFCNAIYDTNAVLKAAGIGRVKLLELRKSRRLKTSRLDNQGRAWYHGSDLIALIMGEQNAR